MVTPLRAADLAAVVEQMPAGVIVFDPETRAADLTNAAALEILARPLTDVLPLFDEYLTEALKGRVLTDEHLPYERPDRVRLTLSVNAAPIRSDDGRRVIAGVITFTDITDRMLAKRMHELAAEALRVERIATQKKLEELNASLEIRVAERTADLESTNHELETFSYSVSHDLRAPLRAIDGFSQMLVEDHGETLGPDGKHQLDRIRKATQRMAQLIDDLLLLSRASRSELHIQEEISITRIAQSVIDDLLQRDSSRKIETKVEDDLVARGDERLVRVLLENLIGNAFKFTSNKDIASIEVVRGSEGGGPSEHHAPSFVVRDNGAGFDAKLTDRLFRPFQRLHSEKEFEGTGIGLATARRIVTRHGGKIRGSSVLNEGAAFTFSLSQSKK